MIWFTISIDGVPPIEKANKFWVEISRYNGVNFTVLDRSSYIYGYTTSDVVDIVYEKATELGFELDIERRTL